MVSVAISGNRGPGVCSGRGDGRNEDQGTGRADKAGKSYGRLYAVHSGVPFVPASYRFDRCRELTDSA